MKKILFMTLIYFVIISGFFTTKNLMPYLLERFDDAKAEIRESKNIDTTTDVIGVSSTATRIKIWEISINLIKDRFLLFGTGTGDVKDVLVSEYQKNNLRDAVEKRLNPHNQFIQTTLALGIVGLLLLIAIFLISFYYAIIHKNVLLFMFVLLMFFNILVESMLEVQAGIMFFGFFNTLLFLNKSAFK